METIDKVAWIHVRDGRLLCVRSHGKTSFYMPGGKRDPGETDEECVQREIGEELGVTLRPATLRPVGIFEAQADGKPAGTMVRISCWGGDYDGELEPRAEIAELAWLSWAEREHCSPAARVILDSLQEQGKLG